MPCPCNKNKYPESYYVHETPSLQPARPRKTGCTSCGSSKKESYTDYNSYATTHEANTAYTSPKNYYAALAKGTSDTNQSDFSNLINKTVTIQYGDTRRNVIVKGVQGEFLKTYDPNTNDYVYFNINRINNIQYPSTNA